MIVINHIGMYTTNRDDTNEHLSGLLEVFNEPPKDLECPGYNETDLKLNVVLIDSESSDPTAWQGCLMQWDGHDWFVEAVQPIENGRRSLISIIRLPRWRVILCDTQRVFGDDDTIEMIVPGDDRTHAGVIARHDKGSMTRYKVLTVEQYDEQGEGLSLPREEKAED
jgi:hypothetical protein